MSVTETLEHVTSAPSSGEGADSHGLALRLYQEKFVPPESLEAALERVKEAKDSFDVWESPEVNLPDTPPPTLRDLLRERQVDYWLQHGEVREGSRFVKDVGYEMNPVDNVWRLIAHLRDEVPPEALDWGVAKSMLARKLFYEIRGAKNLGASEADIESSLDGMTNMDVIGLASGDASLEIQGGRVIYRKLDTAKQLLSEISKRQLSWQERHKLLARSRKLKTVIPFLRNTLSGVRTGSHLWDLFQFSYLAAITDDKKEKQ